MSTTVYGQSGCVAWLKRGTGIVTSIGGSTPAADQTTPAGWNDASGNGANATVSANGGTAEYFASGEGFNRACLALAAGGNVSIPVSYNINEVTLICTLRRQRGNMRGDASDIIGAAIGPTVAFGSGSSPLINATDAGLFYNGISGNPQFLTAGGMDTDQPGVFAFVSDAANSQVRMYFNNVEAVDAVAIASEALSNITIGVSPNLGTGFHWNGYLSEAIVYNSAFTDAQIQSVRALLNAENNLSTNYGATRVTCLGDSLTYGYNPNTALAEPPSTPYLWNLSRMRPDLQFINAGYPGATATGEASAIAADFGLFVNSGPLQTTNAANHVLMLWLGTTDINNGASSASVITALQQIVTAAHSNMPPIKVVGLTMIARAWSITQATGDSNKLAVNTAATNGTIPFDAVVPLHTASQLSTQTDTTYFCGDFTHLTPAGQSVVAGMVKSVLDTAFPAVTASSYDVSVTTPLNPGSPQTVTISPVGGVPASATTITFATQANITFSNLSVTLPTTGHSVTTTLTASSAGFASGGTFSLSATNNGGLTNPATQTVVVNSASYLTSTDIAHIVTATQNASSGTGPNAVTLTVNNGSSPIQSATVSLNYNNVTYTGTTNTSGNVSFSLMAATYTVAIVATGYEYTPSTLVVAANPTTATVSMTAVNITAATNPGQTTGFCTTYDAQGNVMAHVLHTFQLATPVAGDVRANQFTASSDQNGLLQVTLLQNQSYLYKRGGGTFVPFTTGSASTYALPSVLGADAS